MRAFFLWLGSYVIVGILLFVYAGVPLLPIVLAGAATLAVTFARTFKK